MNARIEESSTAEGYNFAYLDEQTKRMIRRALLKAVAVPGYQVPFASREMPLPYGWGTGGLQVTSAIIGRSDRNRELLWAGMLSALITASLSGLLPALGPCLKGDMPKWSAVLVTLRDGSLSRFALLNMAGIVTFPSFHTALAILLVYVHRPPLRSFVPVLILNVVMLVAIPFAGHHYLVDMIAGASVAAISIAIVRLAIRPGLSDDSLSTVAASN